MRTHPDSGSKILYLDESTEVEVVGVPPSQGAALVERLRAHLLQPRFAYTHRWQVGDIVYWDNQATLHSRSAFDGTYTVSVGGSCGATRGVPCVSSVCTSRLSQQLPVLYDAKDPHLPTVAVVPLSHTTDPLALIDPVARYARAPAPEVSYSKIVLPKLGASLNRTARGITVR